MLLCSTLMRFHITKYCNTSKRLMSQRSSLSSGSQNLNRATSVVISGILTIGAFTYYRSKAKMEERFKGCEYLPDDENFKTTNVK